jgi:DNA polymerase-3 subunit gamma/tau
MKNNNNKVLALKYRPKNFNELIGQDILVETITNSINSNKIPNAYLFTGIRGVGKTTTARIVAKSLNCKNSIANLCKDDMCEHCEGITNSNHLDVLEMDAASRTGIDDIRELIESSRYNPTSAKYKIFIIDEVHMLSKQAFNGLLKTLEEPPPHVKFIFATTEIKKIPVTIISRCQRFDLNRISINILFENLKKISKLENGNISDSALKIIAKASEGSVRDSLSLLDRALITQSINNKEVNDSAVRKMLGIGDRSKILDFLQSVIIGDKKTAIEKLKIIVNEGVEPSNFLNDLLEIIYFIQQKKSLGHFDSDLSISEAESEIIDLISKDISISTLVVFWQFILKGIEELSIVTNPILSLEMLVVRLIHLKDMPSFENTLESFNKNNLNLPEENSTQAIGVNEDKKSNLLNEETEIPNQSKEQMKNIRQTKPDLSSLSLKNLPESESKEKILSLEDLIFLSSKKKEVELKYDLEKNVNLIKFSEGKIDISFNENLGKNFVRQLSEKLLLWTGKRWVITLTKGQGEITFFEKRAQKKKQLLDNEKKGETYKKFKTIFSDAELIEVSEKE